MPSRFATCAEISFSDSEGNSGTVSISMAAGAENTADQVSFHSAVYTSADQTKPIGSLARLHERLLSGSR